MKKVLLLALVVIGGVMSANATDYYVGAEIGSSWSIQGQMTDDDGDGTFSLIVTLPTSQGKMYFTVFTENSINWDKAYRPDNSSSPWITNTIDEISMLESNANGHSICYPIYGEDVGASYNNARAIRIEYAPSTKKLKVIRLIAVASGYNAWSTTTDYLTETACGSKIYTGKVKLEKTSASYDDGFKFVYLSNGVQDYGGKNSNGYIGNDGSNYTVDADGIYNMYAQFNDWKWTDPTLVTVPVTIGDAGYSTFSSEYPVDFTNATDVTAYRAEQTIRGEVLLKKVTGTVAANTGLVLNGTAGASPSIPTALTGATFTASENYLVATVKDTEIKVESLEGSTFYFLAGTTPETIGFYQLGLGTYTSKAGKAYYRTGQALTTSASRAAWIIEGEDTQGINNVESTQNADVVYDLQGRVAKTTKAGVYIKNGKKVVMK